MNIISKKSEKSKDLSKKFSQFCKEFKLFTIMRRFGAEKIRGVSFVKIFEFLYLLVFNGRNIFTANTNLSDDCVHRFLKNAKIHWEKILLVIATAVIAKVNVTTSENRINAIIVDDSPYMRKRSKKVELLAKFQNHIDKSFYMGFQMLTLGWTDGNTFIPFAEQLMSSQKSENKTSPDHRTIAGRRHKCALQDKLTRLYALLKSAKTALIPAKHVLFDSWFSNPITLMTIKQIGYFCVAMLKKNSTKYRYNGELFTLNQIYKIVKKRPGMAKWLASVDVTLEHKDFKNGVSAKIVFCRCKSNRKKWCAVISTDVSLNEEEVISLYGKRWDIEVFFKMCKSYLKLAKEYQGQSYNAITGHTTIVFIRYISIAWEQRCNRDSRCFGELFFFACDELNDKSFAEYFDVFLIALIATLREDLFLTDEQVDELLNGFISRIPAVYAEFLVKCES